MRPIFYKIFFFLLSVTMLVASCKTLDVNSFYTNTERNIIPNVETQLDYTTENLFYLNAFANMKLLYKRAKQDLLSDAQLIYYNEMKMFHSRSGPALGQMQIKVKNVNLTTSAIWATVISGITFCSLNLFGFPLVGYQCKANIEMMVFNQDKQLLGTYPGSGLGKSLVGLYFNYNQTDAQKKAHLESFKNALQDALNKIEKDKNFISAKLNSNGQGETTVAIKEETNSYKNLTKICDIDEVSESGVKKDNNLFALVFGNENYKKFQSDLSEEANVDFANRDAVLFAEYCKKVFGVPDENLVLVLDATSAQMKREIEKISKLVKYANGEGKIIFYYAGHGFPDDNTKEAYLIPCDVTGTHLQEGIALNWLYEKLTENKIKLANVFLDACFSGGARNKSLVSSRGIKIVPKKNRIPGNIVVMSASSNDQSAYSFNEKQHGLFTYYLVKKIKESKGSLSYQQLYNYIFSEVGKNALRLFSAEQEPTILFGEEAKSTLEKSLIED